MSHQAAIEGIKRGYGPTYCSLCLAPCEPSSDPRLGWEHTGRSPIEAWRRTTGEHRIGLVIGTAQRDKRLASRVERETGTAMDR